MSDMLKLGEEFQKLLDSNSYAVLSDIRELFQPKRLSVGYGWGRISAKGEMEVHDYDAGVLYVRVSVVRHFFNQKENMPDEWYVSFHISCLDDGEWAAWSPPTTDKESVQQMVDKIGEEVLPLLTTLPNSEDLNKLLRPYGLYGKIGG